MNMEIFIFCCVFVKAKNNDLFLLSKSLCGIIIIIISIILKKL